MSAAVWCWTYGEWEGEADLRDVTAGGQKQMTVGPINFCLDHAFVNNYPSAIFPESENRMCDKRKQERTFNSIIEYSIIV